MIQEIKFKTKNLILKSKMSSIISKLKEAMLTRAFSKTKRRRRSSQFRLSNQQLISQIMMLRSKCKRIIQVSSKSSIH